MGFSHAAVGAAGALELPRRPAGARGGPRRRSPDAGGCRPPSLPARPRERPLDCGNCRAPMQRLGLPGHYGANVEIDVCAQLRPGLVRRHRDRAPERPRPARADRPDGRGLRPAVPAAQRRHPLPALRRPAEDGAQPVALGPLGAAAVPEARRRLPVVRRVPRGEGAAQADVAARPGQAAAASAAGSTASTAARRSARTTSAARTAPRCPACSTSPGWRGRSIRRRCSLRTRRRGRRPSSRRCSAPPAAPPCRRARR